MEATRRGPTPLAHQQPEPDVQNRSLQEYDRMYGVEVLQEALA
ncbi:MAG TPA: hypothetical protein VKR06_39890 [Ktedonosporobacter sp.]|nr:hypothetical protein [Ktedonosporobacter sp.]